jgi:hypothetical protein
MNYLNKSTHNVTGTGIDPITQGEFSYREAYIPIYSDNKRLTCLTELIISSQDNNPFFARIEKAPMKIQGIPLTFNAGNEEVSVLVEQVEKFSFNEDKTEINLSVRVVFLDNLEFVEAIQNHKWYWGKN